MGSGGAGPGGCDADGGLRAALRICQRGLSGWAAGYGSADPADHAGCPVVQQGLEHLPALPPVQRAAGVERRPGCPGDGPGGQPAVPVHHGQRTGQPAGQHDKQGIRCAIMDRGERL